jgi:hypothetical protein
MGQPLSKCTIRIRASCVTSWQAPPLLHVLTLRSFFSIPLLPRRMHDHPRPLAILSQLCQHKTPLLHIPTITCCHTLLIRLGSTMLNPDDLDFDLHTSRPSNLSCSRVSLHSACAKHILDILKIYTRTRLLIGAY